MSITQTPTDLVLTIPPIQLPFLTNPIPTQELTIAVPLNTLKTSMRLVVIISTYLLFRPHLEKLFRTITGQRDEAALNVQERMEFLKKQGQGQGQSTAGRGVSSPSPATNTASTGSSAKSTPRSTKASRRKA